MNSSVREELRAHIIEVVAFLEVTEIGPKSLIVEDGELLGLVIQFLESIILELVAKPGGEVSFLVCPGNRIRNIQRCHRSVFLDSLGRSNELEFAVSDDCLRKVSHKIKDAALGLLVLSEGLVIHKQVHDVVVLGC